MMTGITHHGKGKGKGAIQKPDGHRSVKGKAKIAGTLGGQIHAATGSNVLRAVGGARRAKRDAGRAARRASRAASMN